MNIIKLLLTRALLIAVACGIGFGVIADWISDEEIEFFDRSITTMILACQSPAMTVIMKFFTSIGSGLPVAVITGTMIIFLYVFVGLRRELYLVAGVAIGSALLNITLKTVFSRARPTLDRIIDATGYSFPSGHSMAAFTLYGILAFVLWKHIPMTFGRVCLMILSAVMILMIGISRIYLGVHYPSDVLGGFLASGSWLAVSVWFYERYQERHARNVNHG